MLSYQEVNALKKVQYIAPLPFGGKFPTRVGVWRHGVWKVSVPGPEWLREIQAKPVGLVLEFDWVGVLGMYDLGMRRGQNLFPSGFYWMNRPEDSVLAPRRLTLYDGRTIYKPL